MKFGVCQAIPRIEDSRLIAGEGRYTDDIDPGTGLAVAFLRAPLAGRGRARTFPIESTIAGTGDPSLDRESCQCFADLGEGSGQRCLNTGCPREPCLVLSQCRGLLPSAFARLI